MKWQRENRDVFQAYKRQWQRDNSDKIYGYVTKYKSDKPQQVKKWRREWEQKNSHKSREYRVRKKSVKSKVVTGLVTDNDIRRLLRLPCLYCGGTAEHVDHVFPLSRGGAHTLGNLAPACLKCNLSKSTKTIMEWRIWKMRIGLTYEEQRPKETS
jgi:5-methylcytosine-specific restriction endonuclease McrA